MTGIHGKIVKLSDCNGCRVQEKVEMEKYGGVAHLGERLNGIQEVRSSILLISTTKHSNRKAFSLAVYYMTMCRTDT